MLRDVATPLRSVYGDLTVETTDPFEMVLLAAQLRNICAWYRNATAS